MLQAVIDESESNACEGGLFVMGGYIAPPEKWRAFSGAWEAALRHYTTGRRFHMNEMNGRPIEREAVGYFQSIIAEHVDFGFSVTCLPDMLRYYMEGASDRRFRDPHFYCLWVIIRLVMSQDEVCGKKVDFIFDQGRTRSSDITPYFKSFIASGPEGMREQVPNDPTFRSSHDFLPLQAADMMIWWRRKRIEEDLAHAPRKERPTASLNIKHVRIDLTEQMLRNFRDESIRQSRLD